MPTRRRKQDTPANHGSSSSSSTASSTISSGDQGHHDNEAKVESKGGKEGQVELKRGLTETVKTNLVEDGEGAVLTVFENQRSHLLGWSTPLDIQPWSDVTGLYVLLLLL